MRKLEDAGYLTAQKEFQDRKPITWYCLTDTGRNALKAYFDALQTLIQSAGVK